MLTTNAKLSTASRFGWLAAGLEILPHTMSGDGINVCPWSTPACRASCLVHSGFGTMPSVYAKRAERRAAFLADRQTFLRDLDASIYMHVRQAKARKLRPAVRLNVFSDLPWERIAPWLFEKWGDVQFYDYTKSWERAERRAADPTWPKNYSLTLSWTEEWSTAQLTDALALASVAVPFFGSIPLRWRSRNVINGDIHDLTFLHPEGRILGLVHKGPAGSRPPTGAFGVQHRSAKVHRKDDSGVARESLA